MIKLEIIDVEILSGGDMVCARMNDGSTEVLSIDNKMVKNFMKEEK